MAFRDSACVLFKDGQIFPVLFGLLTNGARGANYLKIWAVGTHIVPDAAEVTCQEWAGGCCV